MNESELVGLPNEVALDFVRAATNSKMIAAAVMVNLSRQGHYNKVFISVVCNLKPTVDHFTKVMALVTQAKNSETLISDEVHASYAI